MRKNRFTIAALLALLVAAAGYAQRAGSNAKKGASELARVPQEARSWKNPYEGQTDAVLAGQKLFKMHCAECHGEDARGSERAPSLRTPTIQKATPGELAWFLKNGDLRAGMPSWSRLPAERRWQLVSYLKTLP